MNKVILTLVSLVIVSSASAVTMNLEHFQDRPIGSVLNQAKAEFGNAIFNEKETPRLVSGPDYGPAAKPTGQLIA